MPWTGFFENMLSPWSSLEKVAINRIETIQFMGAAVKTQVHTYYHWIGLVNIYELVYALSKTRNNEQCKRN